MAKKVLKFKCKLCGDFVEADDRYEHLTGKHPDVTPHSYHFESPYKRRCKRAKEWAKLKKTKLAEIKEMFLIGLEVQLEGLKNDTYRMGISEFGVFLEQNKGLWKDVRMVSTDTVMVFLRDGKAKELDDLLAEIRDAQEWLHFPDEVDYFEDLNAVRLWWD